MVFILFYLWVHVEATFLSSHQSDSSFYPFFLLPVCQKKENYFTTHELSSSLFWHFKEKDLKSFKGGACNYSFLFLNYIFTELKQQTTIFLQRDLQDTLPFLKPTRMLYLGYTFKYTKRHEHAYLNVLPMHEFRTGISMYSLCTDYQGHAPGALRILMYRLHWCTIDAEVKLLHHCRIRRNIQKM